jgi:adenylyltransferase/sulfurtransferase
VLFDDDRIRYGRQIIYSGFGEKGQKKLKAAHMAVLGQADWGVPPRSIWHMPVLCHITIVDSDSVELSNLNRRILHWEQDIAASFYNRSYL